MVFSRPENDVIKVSIAVMRKWQNLCRSQLRNKGERGLTMKRDFLRELGIEDEIGRAHV